MINIFSLLGRSADIVRAFTLFNKNRAENSEMIDLVRSIAGDAGLLEKVAPPGPIDMPPALQEYSNQWIQRSLNTVMGSGLKVDGILGGENSKTRQAVRAFQKKYKPNNVDEKKWVDGDPGIQTIYMLEQELNKLKG